MEATFQEACGLMNTELMMNSPVFGEPSRHLVVSEDVGGLVDGLALDGLDQGTVTAPSAGRGDRLTVCHFIYGIGGGGAESMMRSLVGQLDRRRWRVVVVALQAKAWPEEAASLRAVVDALHVLDETALLSGSTLKKLSRVMRAERPDVVQTWMHHADFTGGLVARFAGVPQVVWGIHCREITRAPGESKVKAWLFAQLLPILAHWVPSRIVSCSEVAMADHVTLGYPRESLRWIPNGVDAQRFRPSVSAREELRSRLGIAEATPLIGFAGRAHEMKNLPLLLQAFGLLGARLPAARLVLCGVQRQELDEESQASLLTLPNQDAVHWLPFQSEPEHFYPGLDLFTLSSRTEACPMTILEAMACGLPCVTTDVGDCARLIGDAGRVVPAGNAEALAEVWFEVLQLSQQARSALGRNARERLLTEFSLERAATRYQDLYETLIPHTQK